MGKSKLLLLLTSLLGLLLLTFVRFPSFNSRQSLLEGDTSYASVNCEREEPFAQGIQAATEASLLAQSAVTNQDWNRVALQWLKAIERMQSLPSSDPKHFFAQKKVKEYWANLQIAQQKVTIAPIDLPFASFNSQFLDAQILLFLSYIAAVGAPDILIMGSSRAVQGIHARYLQQGLGTKNNQNLKVFNFGINGSTAQLVDLMLRELLTQEQLPKLIIWADGVRAFNSGRQDRTVEAIRTSQGYQQLRAGIIPQLPLEEVEPLPDSCGEQRLEEPQDDTPMESLWKSNDDFLSWLSPLAVAIEIKDIDAQGFLPINRRFDPKTYYQNYPRVIGLYDGDYVNFSLQGVQTHALNRIIDFSNNQQIPLLFVNLPLTQDYLDPVRNRAEDQFRNFMINQSQTGNFTFLDLGKQWLTQYQYFADPSHINEQGARAIADQLVDHPFFDAIKY